MDSNNKYPFNTYWTVPEGERDISEVQQILVAHGFDAGAIPQPSEKVNASRCARSFQNRRGAGRKTLADTLGTTKDGKSAYVLLDRDTENDEVSYGETTRIEYDGETDTINATGTMANEYMTRLNARFRGKYCAEDFRAWLLKVVNDCSGVPKRPSGGIYLVAGRFRPVFENVREVLRELSTGADLYIERVWMGEEESLNIRASVSDYLGKELERIANRATELKRESSLTALGDEAKKLAEIQDLFSEALNLQSVTEEVANRVNGIEDILNNAMSGLQDAKAQKKAEAAAARIAAGLPEANHCATPLEVAEEVARQLETMDGDVEVDAMALILKGTNFVHKTSTVFRRVQKAIADGYRKVAVVNGKYHLMADGEALPPAAEVAESREDKVAVVEDIASAPVEVELDEDGLPAAIV